MTRQKCTMKGGIQSRGTTKKEEPEKKNLPARIVEQAGVPKDRVIEKTNLNRPYMVDAILIPAP